MKYVDGQRVDDETQEMRLEKMKGVLSGAMLAQVVWIVLVIVFGVAGVWLRRKSKGMLTSYAVVIRLDGTEVRSFVSSNHEQVARIAAAVTKAIT
jgi:hypothetical protein